jgi:phospholipid transport system substrate-binding protein
MKNWLLRFIFAGVFSLLPPAFAAGEAPDVLAKQTTKKLLTALEQEKDNIKADPSRVYKIVDDILLPHFDFRKMAQLVLGQHWKTASDAQKDQFTAAFRDLLVRTYASSLVDYTGQKIEFQPMTGDPSKDRRVTVSALVSSPGSGDPLKIDSEMYKSKDGWKVYDAKVADVSLVLNYRSSYDAEIKKNGLDNLIEQLLADTQEANSAE